jgi:hypothetical protein
LVFGQLDICDTAHDNSCDVALFALELLTTRERVTKARKKEANAVAIYLSSLDCHLHATSFKFSATRAESHS